MSRKRSNLVLPSSLRGHRARGIIGALLLVLTTFAATAAPEPRPAAAQANPAIDLPNLNTVPLKGWGVSGQNPADTQTQSLDVLVWDFAQIGNRMFVGGAFLNVQESRTSTPISQPYVAAFDVNTGDWISTWRPSIDRAVYSLEAYNGKLLVGGEFETVNGTSRTGLVMLDPVSGQIDSNFVGLVQRPWSSLRATVRDIAVSGNDVYVAGNFSHAVGQWGTRTRVYKAARFQGAQASIDASWKPQVTGSGVWGIDVDAGRGEVHLAGYFSAVNGEANTGYFHTVNASNGATSPGKIDIPRNLPGTQPEFFDVTVGNNTVWAVGEQHIAQTLRASDHQMIAYNHTGYTNNGFAYSGGFAGGAYQVSAKVGDWVFAGCHCTWSVRNGNVNHYSSVTGRRTDHRLVMAYNASTGQLYEPWRADINSDRDGTWAIASSTNGCLWVGGDFHVGGLDAGQNRWLGGFGRFCPNGFNGGGGGNPPPPPPPVAGTLVAAGSQWRYNDSGANLGTAWREVNYNDGGWAVGTAELGFGDGDEGTVMQSGRMTYYARHDFDFAGGLPNSLTVRIKADDGAVVYLNGTELARDNMPGGTITSSTPAAGWRGGADERTFFEYTAPASALRQGNNVLAVEAHNYWASNPDLTIDVQLIESDAAPPAGPFVQAGAVWNYIDNATSTPNGWRNGINNAKSGAAPLGFAENDLATTLPAGNEAYYFTRTFNVANANAVNGMTLGLRADDGAVVYINGTEVARYNMPNGQINWNTRPVSPLWGAAELMQDRQIGAGALVNGTNVVAVEVHNYWPGNADLIFDLRLE